MINYGKKKSKILIIFLILLLFLILPEMKKNRELRRVKTPIEPSEELKGGPRECLRTSGNCFLKIL